MLQRKNVSVNNFRCSVIAFAGQLVHIQLEGHGAEWLVERNRRIAAVTMADARRTAERLFGDGALSVVLVGRPEGV